MHSTISVREEQAGVKTTHSRESEKQTGEPVNDTPILNLCQLHVIIASRWNGGDLSATENVGNKKKKNISVSCD